MAELTKLGRYQLRGVLGRGAMGVVYEGFDPTIGRRVAVKTILKNAAIDDETARAYSALFAREAQAAGRLSHPNIIQVYDFAEEQDIAYLVMEYIQGRELRSFFVSKEKFEPTETVRIMGELLDALDFAHEAGVIHRDIKPANVMLDAQQRVKLADFGVARIQESDRSAAGTMVGTPAFMSPEQISGGKIDRRTDVFSAGTILYQLLTGEQPFTGDGAWTVAKKIMQDDPARPSSIVTNLPLAFDEIVHRALAKKSADRFASAREFAAALRGVAGASAPSQATVAIPAARAAKPAAKASDAEVEFWRAIQNSSDPDEIAFYLEQFPEGTYASLARHKIAKLREPENAARKAGEETVRLEAQAKARLEAEDKAKREAEEQSQQEAEAKTRREAQEKAKREEEAQAKREAEEKTKREALEKAKREAEIKAKREAAEKVRREADEKARRETEEKVRQAQALAKLRQQEEAAARAQSAVDEDATVAIGGARPSAPVPVAPPAQRKTSYAIPAAAASVVIAIGIGAYVFLGRTPAPATVAQVPATPKVESPAPAAPPKAEVSAADIDKIRKETEDRVRREYADKSAAEQAAAMRAAADRAVQEKQLAAKAAADKAAADKAAAEKAVAEKAAGEKTMTAKAAAEKAAAEKAVAEKLAAEKIAADRVAAEKVVAEKAAAERAATEKIAAEKAVAAIAAPAKAGWPSVGDRWVYEARESPNTDKKYQVVVDVLSVSPSGIRDRFRSQSVSVELTHLAGMILVGVAPGIASFTPYLRAFHEVRGGENWDDVAYQRLPCPADTKCKVTARVVGKERVSVRAGSFDAWKITVEHYRMARFSSYTSRNFTYWYAEDAKRVIKYQSRTKDSGQPDIDMELLSYTPAGTK